MRFLITRSKLFIILCILCHIMAANSLLHSRSRKPDKFSLEYALIFKKLWTFDPNHLGYDPYKETLKLGYPAEKHVVQTKDNYLINILRIPRGKNLTDTNESRPVVILSPALFCTAACFTDRGPETSLSYLLVDAGYDVWIVNHRGTTFSRSHVLYDPIKDKQFWDFSWHELGTLDLTATIDYALNLTEQNQARVVSFSQGTTAMFVMLAELPEYNEKIKVAFALGPCAFVDHTPLNSPIRKFLANSDHLEKLTTMLKMYGVYPHTEEISQPIMKLWNFNSTDEQLALCKFELDIVVGHPQEQIDPGNIAQIISHYPGGASVGQLKHCNQLFQTGRFARFDYGKLLNKRIYGQEESPLYNLKNIQAPIYLMYGGGDVYVMPEDIKNLHRQLNNSKLFLVNYPPFSHLDFLYARDVKELVYDHIIEILNKYY